MPQTIRHCCFNIPHNRTILALALVVTTTASLTAADSLSNRAGAVIDSATAAKIAARVDAANAARRAALSGDGGRTEAAIAVGITAERGSPLWHLQVGQRLTQLAGLFVREGEAKAAELVATQAVKRLEVAARQADDANLRAGSWRRMGHLFEDVLGDPESAKACYAEALRLSPESLLAADALKRITSAEEGVRQATRTKR